MPDGSLEITFRVAGLDEIKRWILSFGPEAVVLEPEKLKEMVEHDLNKTLTQYAFASSIQKTMRLQRQINLILS